MEDVLKEARKTTAVCILGMHRSGTSSVTRAVNFLGFFLGNESKLMGPGVDNPEKFWEHVEICALQDRLLNQLNRSWDTALPLPEGWQRTDIVRPFREELKRLITHNFSGHSSWAWKDPRSCLLMPLWREILAELQVDLRCVFVVRSPVEVKNSLAKRDPISFNHAMGVWFNYCITALKDTAGVPTAFVSYDRFLASWESELRRSTGILDLDWPADEESLFADMSKFLRPDLRHNRSTSAELKNLPPPVQKLYGILTTACTQFSPRGKNFEQIITELSADFQAYANFFEYAERKPVKSPFIKRTLCRLKKSFRKRFSR